SQSSVDRAVCGPALVKTSKSAVRATSHGVAEGAAAAARQQAPQQNAASRVLPNIYKAEHSTYGGYNCVLNSLSIVVPAYDEEKRLPPTLALLARWLEGQQFRSAEIVVVDDGSRDGTAAMVERFAANNPAVRLLRNPGNRGKGYSVRHGMLRAASE